MKLLYSLIALLLACSFSYAQTIIKMEKQGGVYIIPCKVNGLELNFIFDTGASDVSISLSEALFMIKNGYMKEDDIKGTEYYRIANGDISEGTKIIIRKLEVGGKVLYNVEASVVHSLESPLLLGQSALSRFGKFSIDYATNSLILGNDDNDNNENQYSNTNNLPTTKNINAVIGNQIWAAENSNVNFFQNGDEIVEAKTVQEWIRAGDESQPAWCYYENDPNNGSEYGKLYNWYAVKDQRGLCPIGWHVSSEEEWITATNFLGGVDKTGIKMKSEYGWNNNGNGYNSSGLTCLPAGTRDEMGAFKLMGSCGCFWFSTNYGRDDSKGCVLNATLSKATLYHYNKSQGKSVRCIMD